MISADELISKVRAYNPKCQASLLREAYDFGKAAHEGQFRQSGEPYFSHPVEVAMQLADQRLDDATLITALLHDTIEDTGATYADVATRFGVEVADLVDGVTKLTNLQMTSTEAKQAENFRKLFMAMSKDLRVILVKLADRLHNMRTIKAMRPEKQAIKARETMDIYAPLAGRMGMQWMRDELEDLAFDVLNPEGRRSIILRFAKLSQDSGDVVNRITHDIEAELDRAGIRAEVYGRAKRPYSIWRKMQEKGVGFSRLSDIYGFRVITNGDVDCYRVLGVIHGRWRSVPGRFKDYISQPKSNGYRSIHTTVSGRDGKRVEVQIRTHRMHEVAEGGVAAHWSYKDGERTENPFAVDPTQWLKRVTEGFDEELDHDAFLEHVKLEMFTDKVFCFTPKGEVVKLPKGATAIDFAYSIHTRIGDKCVGAKIDGMRAPLWTVLRNGQSVQIVTAEGQVPQASWLDSIVTGRAKQRINRALREQHQEQFVKLGRELTRVAFEHVNKKANDKALGVAAQILNRESIEDLLADVGSTKISAQDIVSSLFPELVSQDLAPEVDPDAAIVGLEQNGLSLRAPCCQPVPGERIVGVPAQNGKIDVHGVHCDRLIDLETIADQWLDLRWAPGRHAASYAVSLNVVISNSAGVLGRICTLIGEQNANIDDLVFTARKQDFYRLRVDVEVRDLEHLHAVIMTLDAESDVSEVKRKRET